MKLVMNGFTFLEIMGALLIFSLLGTAVIISQGSIAQAMQRAVGDVATFFNARAAYGVAARNASFVLKKEASEERIISGKEEDFERFTFLVKELPEGGPFALFGNVQYVQVRPFAAVDDVAPLFETIPTRSYVAPKLEKQNSKSAATKSSSSNIGGLPQRAKPAGNSQVASGRLR